MNVKELKTALENFPDDAQCWTYEGEQIGIVVAVDGKENFIPCSINDQ